MHVPKGSQREIDRRAGELLTSLLDQAGKAEVDALTGRHGGRPPAFDARAYKQRNAVERTFNRIKSFRAVATRYDKGDYTYRGTVDAASIKIWLRDTATDDP